MGKSARLSFSNRNCKVCTRSKVYAGNNLTGFASHAKQLKKFVAMRSLICSRICHRSINLPTLADTYSAKRV